MYGCCDDCENPEEILTPCLAISLIHDKLQSKVLTIEIPEPGSQEEKVWLEDGDYCY